MGSVTIGAQSPGWRLGQSPQKPENNVHTFSHHEGEHLIECQKFHTVQRKNCQRGNFRGGHVPLDPLLFTPVVM